MRVGLTASLALLLLGLAPGPTSAARAPDPAALEAIRTGRLTGVFLLDPSSRVTRPPFDQSGFFEGVRILRQARMDGRWRREMLARLADPRTYGDDCGCVVCVQCAGLRPSLGVRIESGGRWYHAIVSLDDGQIYVRTDSGGVAAGRVDVADDALRRLVARAFPRDPALQRLNFYGVVGVEPCRDPGSKPQSRDGVVVDRVPAVVRRVEPRYPDVAREAGVDGVVMVDAVVGCDGHVADMRVIKSIPMLDAAAEEAVRQWTFVPAVRERNPVAVWIRIPIRFSPPLTGVRRGPADRVGRELDRVVPPPDVELWMENDIDQAAIRLSPAVSCVALHPAGIHYCRSCTLVDHLCAAQRIV